MGAGVLTSEGPWSVPQKLPTMFVVEPPSSCVLLMAILVALASAARGTRELGIYGGDRATTEDYPFAAILCSRNDPVQRMYSGDWCDAICTASLVSPGVIMTAAHCFNDFMGLFELDNNFQGREAYERRVLSSYRVIFGENASGPHLTSKAVRVKKIVVAEPFSFEEGSPSWDVALVFLEDCNDEVEPIQMLSTSSSAESGPTWQQRPWGEVKILGWGDSEDFCVSPYRMMDYHDPLQVMSYNVTSCDDLAWCEEEGNCDEQKAMCLVTTNVASCGGDSGGPVFAELSAAGGEEALRVVEAFSGAAGGVSSRGRGGRFVQVGILSGGEILPLENHAGDPGTGEEGFRDEATAALVPAYEDWLRKYIQTDECLEKAGMTVDDLFLDLD